MDIIKELFGFGDAQSSDLGEIANLQSILNPLTPELMPERKNRFGGPFRPELNDPYRSVMELMPDPNFPQFAETNMGATGTVPTLATGTVPTLKEGILSQVDSRFPLYDDFTVAEKGDDLEDNAVTVDELGNLKQPAGFKDFLKTMVGFAIPGANLFMGDRSASQGIKSLNQRLRNTDFGRSKNLMDYLDMRKYGGYEGRENARVANMAQARGIQKKIDTGKYRRTAADNVIDRGRGERNIASRAPKGPTGARRGIDARNKSSIDPAEGRRG